MQLKDNKVIKKAVVLFAVVALTGAIGVVLSAQMGQQRGPGGQQGPGGPGMGPGGRGMMGGPGGRGMMGGPGGRGMMGGPFEMIGRGLRELDLTDAQREQVRGIFESHQDGIKALGDKMMEARQGLHETVTSGAADEAAIRAAAGAVGAVEADAAVLHAKIHAEVLAVLTSEQQQKAKDLRNEMQQRMKNGRERIRQRLGGRLEQKRGRPQAV